MRRLLLALAALSAGCLDLDHLMHLHDLGVVDAGVEDLSGVDQAAGTFTWTGPVAGNAGPSNSVRVANGTTYLATARGGIWASTDDMTWSWVSATLGQHTINDVAVDASGAIYAATPSSGVWKSTDGGNTWASLAGSPSPNTIIVAPPPQPSDTAVPYTLYAGAAAGVYVSYDSGATWALVKSTSDMGITGPSFVRALLLDPAGPLYAGGSNGVFVYSGDEWEAASKPGVVPKQVDALTLAGTELYAGSSVTLSGATAPTGLLYKTSTAPGAGQYTWSSVMLTPMPTGIQALAYDGSENVYASSVGTARYTIGTTTSAASTADDQVISGLAYDTAHATLCAAGTFGFASATASAPTLTTHADDLHNAQITSIADEIANVPVAFAGSITGQVVRTTNSGTAWVNTSAGLVDVGAIHVIVSSPVTNTRAYVGADAGLYATTTTGSSWTPVGTAGAPPIGPVTAFASDPMAENTLYAGSPDGVHKSTNGGASWTLLTGAPTSATSILVTAHALYIAGTSSLGDGGAGLPVLVRSTDGGTTLELADDNLPGIPITQLLGTGATTDTLYAATLGDGVYRSTDGAMTWQSSNTGLGNTTVRGIAFAPSTPLLVYAATPSGVFASVNGAASWSNVTTDLANTDVLSIAVSGSLVLIGTNGDGVFYGQ